MQHPLRPKEVRAGDLRSQWRRRSGVHSSGIRLNKIRQKRYKRGSYPRYCVNPWG